MRNLGLALIVADLARLNEPQTRYWCGEVIEGASIVWEDQRSLEEAFYRFAENVAQILEPKTSMAWPYG